MTSISRTTRLANEIKKALAQSLHVEIKDPRLSPMAAITRVELTRDLKYAKVYVSVYDDGQKVEDTMEALGHAEGFIKKIIGEKVKIRVVPSLSFILDDSAEYSVKMSKLIDETRSRDREKSGDGI